MTVILTAPCGCQLAQIGYFKRCDDHATMQIAPFELMRQLWTWEELHAIGIRRCSACEGPMFQRPKLVIPKQVGGVPVQMVATRTDGLTMKDIPPFVCRKCVEGAR